ncbi:MAG: ThuA domain-containing protein, partial [Sedimentisphaerales bacterium]|nr:ThuA domain-containing protein [Sedimentisphaerales bacterium]
MNRGAIGLSLSAAVVVLFVVVLLAVFASNARGDGSPKQLQPVSEAVVAKIEAAVPASAAAKPAKARKILVFWLCKGYFHECIPVANKAIEVMGKKTGAFDVVFSDDMNMFDANKLAEFDA